MRWQENWIIGPEWEVTPEQMRAQSRVYCEAVVAAHPELAPLLPAKPEPKPAPKPKREPKPSPELAPVRSIAHEVAEKHGVALEAMLGKGRTRPLVAARQEAFYRARAELRNSYAAIGRVFHRDHATVLYGAHRHAWLHSLPYPDDSEHGPQQIIARAQGERRR